MPITNAPRAELRLMVRPCSLSCFFSLLLEGFMIRAQVGCSVYDLLHDQVGIDEKLLEAQVQTAFLNGKAVDDLHQSIIDDGSFLALSGAMPGLVGAAFRKSGFYAGLRRAVSFESKAPDYGLRPGTLTVKLFNLTGPAIGPFFLRYGIEIAGGRLESVFQNCDARLFEDLQRVEINGKAVAPAMFRTLDLKSRMILLFIAPSAH